MNPTIPVRAPVTHPRVGADRATLSAHGPGRPHPLRAGRPIPTPRRAHSQPCDRSPDTIQLTPGRVRGPTRRPVERRATARRRTCGRWPMPRRRTSCAPRSRSTWSRPRVDDMTGRRAAAWRNGARGRRPVQASESRRTPPRWNLRPHRCCGIHSSSGHRQAGRIRRHRWEVRRVRAPRRRRC